MLKYLKDGDTWRFRSAHPSKCLRASALPPQPSPRNFLSLEFGIAWLGVAQRTRDKKKKRFELTKVLKLSWRCRKSFQVLCNHRTSKSSHVDALNEGPSSSSKLSQPELSIRLSSWSIVSRLSESQTPIHSAWSRLRIWSPLFFQLREDSSSYASVGPLTAPTVGIDVPLEFSTFEFDSSFGLPSPLLSS